jgi:hypothetical protein
MRYQGDIRILRLKFQLLPSKGLSLKALVQTQPRCHHQQLREKRLRRAWQRCSRSRCQSRDRFIWFRTSSPQVVCRPNPRLYPKSNTKWSNRILSWRLRQITYNSNRLFNWTLLYRVWLNPNLSQITAIKKVY